MKFQTNFVVFARSYDKNIEQSKIHLISSVFSYPYPYPTDINFPSKLDALFKSSPNLFKKFCVNTNNKFIILRFIEPSSSSREDIGSQGISVIYRGSYVIEFHLSFFHWLHELHLSESLQLKSSDLHSNFISFFETIVAASHYI